MVAIASVIGYRHKALILAGRVAIGRARHALGCQFADHGRTRPLRRGYLAFVCMHQLDHLWGELGRVG